MWQCGHPHSLNITGIIAQKFQTLQDKLRISQGQGAYSRTTNTWTGINGDLLKPEKELHESNVGLLSGCT